MGKKENTRITTFTRRALLLGVFQGGLLAVLGGRLAYLQLAQGHKYRMLSDKNRIDLKVITPSRGIVQDRNGVKLAVNEQNFRVIVIPAQTKDLEHTLLELKKLVDLKQYEIDRVLARARQKADFVPLEVKDNLTWEEVARIEVHLPDFPGLSIDVGETRTYPMGEMSAHLVGYVGAVSRAELNGDPVLAHPGFKIGKTGLERSFDKILRGKGGTAEMEVNVRGREVRELKRHEAAPGKAVTLTVDAELQSYMQERLGKEKSASAVVMDVHTGAVYALASAPAFDPNLFTRGLSAEKWETLLSDPGLPLNNKAVGGQYPPASTFKMVTALAGLEEGVISRNTSSMCKGHYDFGGDRFHCWKRSGHGRVDLTDALAESCDIFFYEMAAELGIDRMASYARKMGLARRFGFELKEERPGLMPTRDWKMGHFGIPWKTGETIVASIGQGYIQATPMQLAVMTARFVNGGFAVKPWITGYVGDEPGKDESWPHLGFDQRHLDLIKRGMDRVVNHYKGTAYDARIDDYGMRMGGKTGTAQVRRTTQREREEGILNSELPWRLRHHALFVGYAPVKAPRYACAVVVEHGGGGSATAAPIARDLLTTAQLRDPAERPLIQDRNRDVSSVPRPGTKPLEKG